MKIFRISSLVLPLSIGTCTTFKSMTSESLLLHEESWLLKVEPYVLYRRPMFYLENMNMPKLTIVVWYFQHSYPPSLGEGAKSGGPIFTLFHFHFLQFLDFEFGPPELGILGPCIFGAFARADAAQLPLVTRNRYLQSSTRALEPERTAASGNGAKEPIYNIVLI